MLGSGTIAAYVMSYMTTYATVTLGMASNLAFGATVTVGLCGVVFDTAGGWLCERFGRRPVMIIPMAFLLAAVFPCFWAIAHYPPWALLVSHPILRSQAISPLICHVTSPSPLRSGALATIYALAISTFGGSTQFVVTWLIKVTGDPLAPAWYLGAAVAIASLP